MGDTCYMRPIFWNHSPKSLNKTHNFKCLPKLFDLLYDYYQPF